MANLGALVAIAFLGILMIVTLNYGQTMMASTATGVNVSGTAYESTYNQTQETTVASMSFMNMLPYLIGLVALIATLFMLMPNKSGYL